MYDIRPGAIINADCLTVLRHMDADSIDMIITDPPYGIDYQSCRPRSKDPTARFKKITNDKSPFIWWIYDAYRVLKEGGGSTVFQPLGCAADVYRRAENRGLFRKIGAGVGSHPTRHGRSERQLCPSV